MIKAKSGSIRIFTLLWFCLLAFFVFAQAQEEKVTLILQSGEEISCRILKISRGIVYFEAASARLAFKYGEVIEVEKIASVRRSDGRTLSMNDFLALRHGASPTEKSDESRPSPPATLPAKSPALPPSPSGPGMRLTSKLLDTTRTTSVIGLRLPELPPSPPATPINYIELADLLAESGIAGKLLYEINAGVLRGRELTPGQKELVDALLQSPVWNIRKRDLAEARRIASKEFELITERYPLLLSDQFRFRPTSRDQAFLEFVQFLHIQNVLYFEDKWQQVETAFGEKTASALRDILNNYEDWYYLFGQELEKW